MKTKDAYNGSRRMGERFLRLWSELAQGVFPFIMEEVWELDYGHRLFVSVCEAVIDPKEFEYAKWCGNGRPKADRVSMFKAYILKMTLNLKGDKELVELLRQQPLSRRMCGWGGAGMHPKGAENAFHACFALLRTLSRPCWTLRTPLCRYVTVVPSRSTRS